MIRSRRLTGMLCKVRGICNYSPRTKSQGLPGNKKSVGPEGRVGRTLEPVEEPDCIEVHVADRCTVCDATLKDVKVDDCQRAPGSSAFHP